MYCDKENDLFKAEPNNNPLRLKPNKNDLNSYHEKSHIPIPAKRQALAAIGNSTTNVHCHDQKEQHLNAKNHSFTHHDIHKHTKLHLEILSEERSQDYNESPNSMPTDISLSSPNTQFLSSDIFKNEESINGDKSVLMVSVLEDPLKDQEPASRSNSTTSPMVVSETKLSASTNGTPVSRLSTASECELPAYFDDILAYLKQMEIIYKPRPTYMSKQPDITFTMRATVVDWLVEVAVEYKLLDKTLFLACSYIDRFLSIMAISRNKLQLLGTTAMFIAAKFEEIYPPDINEFVYITDGTYTREQVIRMEQLILKILSFRVAPPTIVCFLHKFCKLAHLPRPALHLAQYLSELTLLDGEVYLKYEPSIIACAAICLSNLSLQREPWGPALQKLSGYSYTQFLSCLKDLYKSMCCAAQQSQQHKAVYDKYQSIKLDEVAKVTPPPPYDLLITD